MEHFYRPMAGFFVGSLALHVTILLLWSQTSTRSVTQEKISVSLLPTVEETFNAPAANRGTERPREAPARLTRSRAIIGKKNSPEAKGLAASKRPPAAKAATDSAEEQEIKQIKPEPALSREPAPARERVEENLSISERRLPTMQELLPPVTWSSPHASNSRDGAIALNTRDPQYVTYFNSIKRNIEFVWEYPEPALRYGLQGKLLLQFTILASGELESAHIVRSSGSNLLDYEALRAMKAAAPFRPIPPWIDKSRLTIMASFEYLDNRLNYGVMP